MQEGVLSNGSGASSRSIIHLWHCFRPFLVLHACCVTQNVVQRWSQKCMVMKFEVFEGETCIGLFGGSLFLSIFARKTSLEHHYFTTFFTLKFAMGKDICHLVLTLWEQSWESA